MIAISISVMIAMGLWLLVLVAYAIDLNISTKKQPPTVNVESLFQYLIINGEPLNEEAMRELEQQVIKQINEAAKSATIQK